MRHMSDDRDGGNGWHVDKRVNVGHIITTLMIAVAAFAWAGKADTRIAVLEERSVSQKETELRRDKAFSDSLGDLKASILLLNEKIDRIIDKQQGRR